MSDETDTTSEVARVLGEHPGWRFRAEEPGDWYVCSGCGTELETLRSAFPQEFYDHQAAMLAEAGLLRDQAFVAMLEDRIEATINLADQWEAAQKANRESLARGELAVLHIPDPQDFRYAATGCLDVPPVEAQIATQGPAGATQGGSGDSQASGGLGERLRALVTGADPKATHESVDVVALARLADEADVLVGKHARQAKTIGHLQEVRERLGMVRELAGAIRETSHCSHLATDIETLLDTPLSELRALGDAP